MGNPGGPRPSWDSATAKLILGGQANAADLADLSKLLGETEITETSVSTRQGDTSQTTSSRYRPILSIEALRTLPEGQGVLLLRAAPPVILRLLPWTARPDAPALQTAKSEREATIRAAAAPEPAACEPSGRITSLPVWGPPVIADDQSPASENAGPPADPATAPGGPPPGTTAASRGAPTPSQKQVALGLDALVGDVAPDPGGEAHEAVSMTDRGRIRRRAGTRPRSGADRELYG